MIGQEVRLDLLLGKRVLSKTGKCVGRVQEICTERRGDDLVVTSYRTGGRALVERLSGSAIARPLVQLLARGRWRSRRHLIKWDQLDISDPENPRLTCPLQDLTRIPPASSGNRREGGHAG